MPRKPKRPCRFPGCPNLTDGVYCEEHAKQMERHYEKFQRGYSPGKRYGRSWKRIRDRYVRKHPLCEQCLEGRTLRRRGGSPPYTPARRRRRQRGDKPHEPLPLLPREDPPRARRPVGRPESPRPLSPENGAGSFTQKPQFKRGINPRTAEREVNDMAKDGTYRGGRRVRAGSKPDALADKIAKGTPARRMELPDFTDDMTDFDIEDIGDGVELEGMDMPSPDDYLSAQQKDGKPLGADEIYRETWLWLKERSCERLVNKRLLESYSEAFARYIQCSEAVSKYGMLGKHPTTGAAIASPFTQLLMNFQKQANLLWYEIYDIVKQNCTEPFEGSPQDDVMERLLRARRNT